MELIADITLPVGLWRRQDWAGSFARANAGRSIGQNDLWIAATALAFARPLVSRNRRHFHRVAGLRLQVVGE